MVLFLDWFVGMLACLFGYAVSFVFWCCSLCVFEVFWLWYFCCLWLVWRELPGDLIAVDCLFVCFAFNLVVCWYVMLGFNSN